MLLNIICIGFFNYVSVGYSAIKMRRSVLTILLLFATLSAITAQGEFTNGYIIKNDGTLVYGQVGYVAKGFTPRECVFRWFDISEAYTFLPGDIEAFGFAYGMRYKAAVIDRKKIFVACLTEGVLDLLYDGNRLYLDGMGLGMVPLDNSSGSVNAEGKMVSFNGYKDLIEKLPDPENKFTVPADISLKPEKMAEVIASYNRSRDSHATIFAMNNPSGIYDEMRNQGAFLNNYGVSAGINASKYSAVSTSEGIPQMDFFEISPVCGLFYNRSLSRKNDRFSLQVEVMVFKTSIYFYDEYYERSTTYRSDINIDYVGLKVPLCLKISFRDGRFKPFLNAGAFNMLTLGASYTREGEKEDMNHYIKPFSDNSIVLNKSILGILAGAGMKIDFNQHQSAFLELRCEYGSGIYDIKELDQHLLSFNIVAGFSFR